MRALLGWLRGERKHCQMVRIPTIEEGRRFDPTAASDLVGERTHNVCRIKVDIGASWHRDFNPKRLKASEPWRRCVSEGGSLPPNTLAELRVRWRTSPDLQAALERSRRRVRNGLKRAPRQGTHPMVLLAGEILGIGIETADCWCTRYCRVELRDERRWGVMPG